MFRRNRPVPGNPVIAARMRSFFDRMPRETRASPEQVALAYGQHLFRRRSRELCDEKRLARSPFHVGIGVESSNFDHITKRATLVSDTLLLSHHRLGPAHRVRRLSRRSNSRPLGPVGSARHSPGTGSSEWVDEDEFLTMLCPDLAELGAWLTGAEPLLKAGLAWYLPSYVTSRQTTFSSQPISPIAGRSANVPSALDFLLESGRAVGESEAVRAHPLKSQVGRPVLTMDLPFLDGVTMADFSEITVQEFASYTAFQSFLRQELLGIDTALNAVDSEREMIKIAHRIEDEVRGMRSQMAAVRRKRAVAVSGAVLGTIGASLVAVYGPAFQTAVTALGAAGAGGIWGIVQSAADNSPRTLRDSPWYYVWVLTRNSERYP
ncbi:hypothetical protein [Streptomyces sp. SYP-A7185]|uniref:hypothetical protein n=1 Tax=Streptomyces sp. SYP-A7185 TaxID=3040076 RepID=UPI0038F7601E